MNLKKIIFAVTFLTLFSNLVFSQTAKPHYKIVVERADTVMGEILIELFPQIAPLHTAYFDSLVNISFYDSLAFHRVVPDFVIQGGDPNSLNGPRETWGEGDSNQTNIPAEFSGVSHQRGIIGAARDTDINSANSQFYVNLVNNDFLDWNYTAYGQVLEGMELVDFISLVPRDANDNPNEKIEMFITRTDSVIDVPLVPVISSPSNETVGILNGDSLKWEAVDGAVMYNLEISKSATFDSVDIEVQCGFNNHRLENIELGNVVYYWRVKSNNGGNESEYSEVRNFVSSIEAPILIYPEMNDDSISVAPEFRWFPVDGATKYKIEISRSPQFQENYIVYSTDTITVNYHTPVNPLENGKSHYWRVYSMTDEYLGPISEFRRFVTPDLVSVKDDEIPIKYYLYQNYPNPFNPTTTIKYSLPESGGVKIYLLDVLGNNLGELLNSKQKSGVHKIEFNAKNLSSGVYFYRIESNNFVQTKKMILLK